MNFIRLMPVQRKGASLRLDSDGNRLDQWRGKYSTHHFSLKMLFPSCLNLVTWFSC